jgi:hypothetical protein
MAGLEPDLGRPKLLAVSAVQSNVINTDLPASALLKTAAAALMVYCACVGTALVLAVLAHAEASWSTSMTGLAVSGI